MQRSGRAWSGCEAAHAAADTPDTAAAAQAVATGVGCPQTRHCTERAELDSCTGLAAGTAWVNGVRKPTAAVMPSPEPPPRRAG